MTEDYGAWNRQIGESSGISFGSSYVEALWGLNVEGVSYPFKKSLLGNAGLHVMND